MGVKQHQVNVVTEHRVKVVDVNTSDVRTESACNYELYKVANRCSVSHCIVLAPSIGAQG